ncbi:hypothetical protein GEMRC1_009922 [Eukaryota sp. GEM-RC1]
MQNFSCSICHSLSTHSSVIFCNRFYCSKECLDQFRSSSHPSTSSNGTPSSSSSPPTALYGRTSFIAPLSASLSSPKHIHLQQSLLILVKSQLLRMKYNKLQDLHCDDVGPAFIDFQDQVLSFFKKVGYLSNQFFKHAFYATTMFFQSNTFHVLSKHLKILSAFAAFFESEIKSIFLQVEDSFKLQDIVPYTSIMSHVRICLDFVEVNGDSSLSNSNDDDYTMPHILLDHSSSFFLQNLRVLDITIDSSGNKFSTFCKDLIVNTTIIELHILILSFTITEVDCLSEVFKSNTTLKIFSLACDSILSDEELMTLFTAISNHSSIEKIDLTHFNIERSKAFRPLLLNSKSSLKRLVFPTGCVLDSKEINTLKVNSSIEEVVLKENIYNSDDIAEVLTINSSLQKIEIEDYYLACDVALSPIFKSLEANTSLLELVINCRKSLSPQESESLLTMLQRNTTLLVLSLDLKFKSILFNDILTGLESNSNLMKVFFLSLDLSFLISVFKGISADRFCCSIDVDPHLIDVKNGFFCFSPKRSTQLVTEEISSLQCFLECFNIKSLFLIDVYLLTEQSPLCVI